MAIAHQLAFSERKSKQRKADAGDGVALTSIAHPQGPKVRKRPAISKGAVETLVATVKDDKIVSIEKPVVLRLDIALVAKIDAAKAARGMKSRSEMIRVLLTEALGK